MKRRIAIIAFVTLVTLTPAAAFAVGLQTIVPSDCNGTGGCQSICDIALLAQNILDDGIYIAIFLSAILFAWAGWQLVVGSATGNSTMVMQGRRIFMYVIGGLVLIISAWLIVSVLMAALTNNANWNNLCNSGSAASVLES